MIKIENLNLSFDNNIFFKDTNIYFEENKVNVITGLNGTGKTTTLKILAKIIKTDANIDTKDKKIFYLPQIITYPKNITLYDYLSSVFYTNWKWRLSKQEKNQIINIIETFGLTEKAHLQIDKMSSGELQKANIALGILSGAELLLLDEPISNMDLINQIKILEIIKELKTQNKTVIMILHDINLAVNYGDYFVGIVPQKDVICKDKKEFFTQENLYNIYNVNFKVEKDEKNIHIQVVH